MTSTIGYHGVGFGNAPRRGPAQREATPQRAPGSARRTWQTNKALAKKGQHHKQRHQAILGECRQEQGGFKSRWWGRYLAEGLGGEREDRDVCAESLAVLGKVVQRRQRLPRQHDVRLLCVAVLGLGVWMMVQDRRWFRMSCALGLSGSDDEGCEGWTGFGL